MKRALPAQIRVIYCVSCDEISQTQPKGCIQHHTIKMTPDTAKKWRLPMKRHAPRHVSIALTASVAPV